MRKTVCFAISMLTLACIGCGSSEGSSKDSEANLRKMLAGPPTVGGAKHNPSGANSKAKAYEAGGGTSAPASAPVTN